MVRAAPKLVETRRNILLVEVAGIAPLYSTQRTEAVRWMSRSKIHKATATAGDLLYEGSITVDQELIERLGLPPGDKVLVVSNIFGARSKPTSSPAMRLRCDLHQPRRLTPHKEG